MAKAPQVETLAQSMAMLDPGFNEQRGLINEQIEGLGAQSDIRRERLEGAKVASFNQINDQALGRGVGAAFSGIPLHEQTDYLAGTFLPGMQDIELMEGKERMQLRSTLADLNLQQRNMAVGRIDQQQQALNQWNLQQAQMEAQRREAEINRQWQTSERLSSQQFSASQNAANRAANAAANAPPSLQQAISDGFSAAIANSEGDWRKNFTTERLIDQLVSQYGTGAKSAVYNFRKTNYGF